MSDSAKPNRKNPRSSETAKALPAPTHQRATPRQATSYMTAPGPLPAEDDPLLGFAPYLHKQPRKNSITPDKQRKFIAMLAATGIVTRAAAHIGVSMEAIYKLRQQPGAEGFSKAWDAAVERGVDRIEAAAMERAINGVADWRMAPDGGLYTVENKYNENLVMFFLRNRKPEKYAAHLRPGHPVYERIRREVLADLMQQAHYNRDEMVRLICAEMEEFRKEQEGAADG